jgi:hypothetical protein
MQLQKRRKKILCSHLSCIKRAQHPPTLCWIHGAKNIVAALTDALKEEFYWVYVPTTVGWCNYVDGKDISTESTWKDGLECVDASGLLANSDDSEGEESEYDGEIRLV